jgi:hypothetical protein
MMQALRKTNVITVFLREKVKYPAAELRGIKNR